MFYSQYYPCKVYGKSVESAMLNILEDSQIR